MPQIPLTNSEMFTLVDEEDLSLALSGGPWHLTASGYAVRSVGKWPAQTKLYLHRLLLKEPDGFVDHVNGDRLDNRRRNLRLASNAQNQHNAKLSSRNKSGFKGVSWDRGSWRGYVCANGKNHLVGRFETAEEADAAVRAARVALHGEFARHR